MKHARDKRIAERVVAAVTAIAACVALAAGGTLAYYSASETAHNVITTGGVGIELVEWADLEKTRPFEDVDGVMPGESVVKVVEVENDGQAPAWVRVKADMAATLPNAPEGKAPEVSEVVAVDWNQAMWTQGEGGWWYYNEILPAGETTVPLFNTVTFDGPGMGDAYQGAELAIDVVAQAVQSDNNGSSALEADGWPEA